TAYLDHTALYNATNFSLDPQWGPGQAENLTVRSTRLAVFLCPSDRNPGQSRPDAAASNYPNNLGNNRRFNNWIPNGPAYFPGWDGSIRRPVTLGMITDGSHYTAMFSEWVKGEAIAPQSAKDGPGLVYSGGFDAQDHY